MNFPVARQLVQYFNEHDPRLFTEFTEQFAEQRFIDQVLSCIGASELSSKDSLDLLRALLLIPLTAGSATIVGIRYLNLNDEHSEGPSSFKWNSRQVLTCLGDISFCLRKLLCDSGETVENSCEEILQEILIGFRTGSSSMNLLSTFYSCCMYREQSEDGEKIFVSSRILDCIADIEWNEKSLMSFVASYVDILQSVPLEYHRSFAEKVEKALGSKRVLRVVGFIKYFLLIIEKHQQDELVNIWVKILYQFVRASHDSTLADILAILETMLLHSPSLQIKLVKGFRRFYINSTEFGQVGKGEYAIMIITSDLCSYSGGMKYSAFNALKEIIYREMGDFSMTQLIVLQNAWKQLFRVPGIEQYFNGLLEFATFLLESCKGIEMTRSSSEFKCDAEGREHLANFGQFLLMQLFRDLVIYRPRCLKHVLSSLTESNTVSLELCSSYASMLSEIINNCRVQLTSGSGGLLDILQDWLRMAPIGLVPDIAFPISRMITPLMDNSSFRTFYFPFMRKLLASTESTHRYFALESLIDLLYRTATRQFMDRALNESMQLEIVDCLQSLMHISKSLRCDIFSSISELALFPNALISTKALDGLKSMVKIRWETYFSNRSYSQLQIWFEKCFRTHSATFVQIAEDFGSLSFVYLLLFPDFQDSNLWESGTKLCKVVGFSGTSQPSMESSFRLCVFLQVLRSHLMASFQDGNISKTMQELDLLGFLDGIFLAEASAASSKLHEDWTVQPCPSPKVFINLCMKSMSEFTSVLKDDVLTFPFKISPSGVLYAVQALLPFLKESNQDKQVTKTSLQVQSSQSSNSLSFSGFAQRKAKISDLQLEKIIKLSVALLKSTDGMISYIDSTKIHFPSCCVPGLVEQFITECSGQLQNTHKKIFSCFSSEASCVEELKKLRMATLSLLEYSLEMIISSRSGFRRESVRKRFQTSLNPSALASAYTDTFVNTYDKGVIADEALAFLGVVRSLWFLSPKSMRDPQVGEDIIDSLMGIVNNYYMESVQILKRLIWVILSIASAQRLDNLVIELFIRFNCFSESDQSQYLAFEAELLSVPNHSTRRTLKNEGAPKSIAACEAALQVLISNIAEMTLSLKKECTHLKKQKSEASIASIIQCIANTYRKLVPVSEFILIYCSYSRILLQCSTVSEKSIYLYRYIGKLLLLLSQFITTSDLLFTLVCKAPGCLKVLNDSGSFEDLSIMLPMAMREFARLASELVPSVESSGKYANSISLRFDTVKEKLVALDFPRMKKLARGDNESSFYVFVDGMHVSSKRLLKIERRDDAAPLKKIAGTKRRRKKPKRKLRSKNSYIDEALVNEEDGTDAYADLEDFIVV